MSVKPCIGIDLGTTYSCVGIYIRNKVEIILNEQGNYTTPSCVAFSDVERLLGEAAKSRGAINTKNTIYGIKRIIGRKYDDPVIQNDMETWPFEVINENGQPVIEVTYRKKTEKFLPEDISAMVLSYMKKIAETHLKMTVEDVVITVPAYFNDSQRQATIDAGRIAGLNVLRIINEPTAAAIAYGLDKLKDSQSEKNVLVFDLGGGTLDVSLLTITKGSHFRVRSTYGDMHLGGMDVDNRLVSYLLKMFKKQYNKDPSSNPRAMFRLQEACEKVKRVLSTSMQADIMLDAFYENIDFYSNISRAKLNDICTDLFERCLKPVEQVLADAKLDKCHVDDIVMVGGSTRIPKVRELVQEFFLDKELTQNINPDEAVAYGAAVQAALLTSDANKEITDIVFVDVAPMSFGVSTAVDFMSTIIEKNTPIPCEKIKEYTTDCDNQDSVFIEIFEGEMPLVEDNYKLGDFTLFNIENAPRDVPRIVITFSLDDNGILQVSAVDKKTCSSNKISVKVDKGRLSPAEIRHHILASEKLQEEDDEKEKIIKIRNEFQNFLSDAKKKIESMKFKRYFINSTLKRDILLFIRDNEEWLDMTLFPELQEIQNKLVAAKQIVKKYTED